MRELLIKDGFVYSTQKFVDPESLQDINESFSKEINGKRFTYLPEEDWKIVYVLNTPTKEDMRWRIWEKAEKMDDIYKFIEKWKDVK